MVIFSGCLQEIGKVNLTYEIGYGEKRGPINITITKIQEEKYNLSTNLPVSTTAMQEEDAIAKFLLENVTTRDLETLREYFEEIGFSTENFTLFLWNFMEWLENNTKYDYKKAEEVYKTNKTVIEHPLEFLKNRRGICADYAVFTISTLLAFNITPVYYMKVSFKGQETKHAAVFARNFVLDQHTPLLDICGYIINWKLQKKIVTNITFYKIELKGDKVGLVDAAPDYTCTRRIDLENIEEMLYNWFRGHYGYIYSPQLENTLHEYIQCDYCNVSLPSIYSEATIIIYGLFPTYQYTKATEGLLLRSSLRKLRIENATKYKYFAIDVFVKNSTIEINNITTKYPTVTLGLIIAK